jgi:hypothetical protein
LLSNRIVEESEGNVEITLEDFFKKEMTIISAIDVWFYLYHGFQMHEWNLMPVA